MLEIGRVRQLALMQNLSLRAVHSRIEGIAFAEQLVSE